MSRPVEGQRRGPSLLVGYLPLLLGALGIMAMVLIVPSEVPDSAGTGAGAGGGQASDDAVGTTASGWDDTVSACSDRDAQVPDSGYSPPCFTFDGDNGGATSVGVTADTIDVTYRFQADGHLLATIGQLAGIELGEDAEDLYRTVEGLVEYFNENFELYGRRIDLDRFEANGSSTTELTGGGRELAVNDALTAVDRETFADVGNGISSGQAYAEQLAASGVVTIGAAYMSREWFDARGPYAWSLFPDCSRVAEVNAEVGIERLLREPAVMAGGDLRDRPRRVGIIWPNQAEYTQCAELAIKTIEDAGIELALKQNYLLDLAATDTTAASIMARLRDEEVTSVACACDPLMQRALAILADQQGYEPEWLIQGVGYVDVDLVGQMIAAGAPDQWARAFGGSPTAAQPEWGTSEGYRAYRSVRDDEPSRTVDLLFGQLYRLAIGIQMAGPNLTPETFATGMYNYPGGDGTLGAWRFGPGNHTGVTDARFVLWRNDLDSTFNGDPGTYVDTGDRFTDAEEMPEQDELFAGLEAADG